MATSGSFMGERTVTSGPQLYLEWVRTAIDIPNNRSKVKLTLKIYSEFRTNFSTTKYGKLEGSSFSYSGGFNGTGYKTIKTKEIWITHNSDGSKSFTADGYLDINVSYGSGYVSRISVSGTVVLEDIPRSSKLNSFSMGSNLKESTENSINLSLTRYSSSFTHDIYLKYGSTRIASWTGQGLPTSLPISSEQVNNLLSEMPKTTSGTMTLIVFTKSGSENIGSHLSGTAKVTIDSSVKPIIINEIIDGIVGDGFDDSIERYVQNISKIYTTFTSNAGYGASVTNRKTTVRKIGTSKDFANYGYSGVSSVLTYSGTYEAIGEVTDSRDRKNKTRLTFVVEPYKLPKITTFYANRISSDDTTVHIRRVGHFSNLGGLNTAQTIIRRRDSNSSTWEEISRSDIADGMEATKASFGCDIALSYEFKLIFIDDFGNYSVATTTVSTAKVVFDIHKDEGVGIGKLHQQGVLDVTGDVYFDGEKQGFITGENANGEYIKFNNGVMICTATKVETIDIDTSYGSLYRSDTIGYLFPADFISTPVTSVSYGATLGIAAFSQSRNNKWAGRIYTSVPRTGDSFPFELFAIGRWK